MDFHLKQWKESDQHFSAKIPKLHHPSPALPLFVHDHHDHDHHQKLTTNLSPFTDYATPTHPTKFPRTGSYFSLGQWQELELQALIFRYMVAGAAVPPELLLPIKKSLLHSTPYNFLQHYQPTLMQSGYWGRLAMDPEPGRCRRTDGKKWRCSRDVVNGHKYCERHMHRGKNRSRKPVEIPTPTPTAAGVASTSQTAVAAGNHFSLSGPSPSIDLLHFSSSSHSKQENKVLFHKTSHNEVSGDGRSDGHVLRHFFDDWPRTVQETDATNNASAMNSPTSLSISMPGNASSDVSLKLSTGIRDESGSRNGNGELQVNWGGSGWGSNHVMTPSMGGPLAEALRSSTSSSSPTSVLHQLPRGSASEISYVST